MKTLTIALIGGGGRGSGYTKYALSIPEKFKVTAIAEPVPEKREYLAKLHNIPEDRQFATWEELLAQGKIADIAMICTQDRDHFAPAMKAMELKYDLLLEKPISPFPEECKKIAQAAKDNNVKVLVCHVLRYTNFYKTIKNFIDDGKLGEIMNIDHTEGVGNIHQSHSFVRGNWKNSDESAPMILAKSCHDTDLLQWLIDKPCTKVQSFGSLSYFKKENAPEGSPEYCMDGCPAKDTCYYYAPNLYKKGEWAECLRDIVANKFEPTDDEVNEALRHGPYGKCAFKCNNNVVDHQVVNMQFGDDKYVTFTMSAFNKGGRTTTIMGTKGELHANMEDSSITFYSFETKKTEVIMEPDKDFDDTINGGHGGGDAGIMNDLYDFIANDKPSKSVSDISVSCKNHLINFAAEEARVNGGVIDMEEYERSL